ncbi:hypothetical protein L7F22_012433 [Adiantum nelumboides]|nr:hypothetical protein [Adiantum nelumboides]
MASKIFKESAGVYGATVGLASTMLVYPFNSVMDCLLLQPSDEYSSLWGSMAKVIKAKAISELYRGIIPALITMIPQVAPSFYTYENVKSKHNKRGKHKKRTSYIDSIEPA